MYLLVYSCELGFWSLQVAILLYLIAREQNSIATVRDTLELSGRHVPVQVGPFGVVPVVVVSSGRPTAVKVSLHGATLLLHSESQVHNFLQILQV